MLDRDCAVINESFGCWNSKLGNIIIKVTIGSPIIVGAMKEANRFSFILFLKGCYVFEF